MNVGHIYIYGEIGNWQSDEAQEWGVISLKAITEAIQSQSEADELIVHIHSIGGDVIEGMAVYDALKATGKKITTINEGACYSIATVVYLAGEKRLTMPHAEFLIHEAWGGAIGNSDDMKSYADQLDKAVDKMVSIYNESFNIDEERIRSIMKEDRIMEVDEAIEIGLATEISEPLKAVAKFKPINKQKSKTMSKKGKKAKQEASAIEKIKHILGISSNPVALKVTTGDQTEIDFTDLEEGATPKKGDKATVNDEPANGEYTLQDGTVYVFVDGVLDEIKEPSNDDDDLQAKVDELQSKLDASEQKLNDLKAKYDTKKSDLKAVNKQLKEIKGFVSDFKIEKKGKQTKKEPKVETNSMAEAFKNLK